MPADYDSTARALALPVSPQRSSPAGQPYRPPLPWTRRRSSQSCEQRTPSFLENLIDNAERLRRKLSRAAKKLTLVQRGLAAVAMLGVLTIGILFLVFNERIFALLEPIAEKWKKLGGGWLILWALTFTTAFPPVIGYSTCVTTAGFVYGFREGLTYVPSWLIVASATVFGSLSSFIVSRTILSNYVHRLVENDTRFAALSLVLKRDGLKLLCMIRLCPLPYSISNGAMSTFETVSPYKFALATAIVTPKLMIHIFIGGRLAAIAKSGEKMDTTTKAINWASIIGGVIIGALTAWFIYSRYLLISLLVERRENAKATRTLARSREIEAEERSSVRRLAPGDEFSDDPDPQNAAAILLRDDHIDFLDHGNDHVEYEDEFTDEDEEDDDRV